MLFNDNYIFMEVYPLVKMDKDFDAIFSNLYSKYYSFLFSYIFSIIHDPDITEDLVHDIFLRLYRLRNLETDSLKIRNYLKKAARNIAIDYLRKITREEVRQKKIITELKEFNGDFYSCIENYTIEGEVISTVNDVLEEFSEKKKNIFKGRFFENKTFRQLSREEKISHY